MAKANRSWQKQVHSIGKSKSLTAKANHSQLKQIHQFSLAFVYKFLFAILQFAKEFLVLAIVNVQYNNNIDQKKPVSMIFIRNLEMKSLRNCVRVHFYI